MLGFQKATGDIKQPLLYPVVLSRRKQGKLGRLVESVLVSSVT
jgi:hypothetical protein